MKIVIAPDKFKGSLTSMEACVAIRDGIYEMDKNIETLIFPMADGGDGFAAVMKHYIGTTTQPVQSVDALGRSIPSFYEWHPHQQTAIVELASCSGLSMLGEEERNPLIASTFGTGLQIQKAIRKGAGKIILGLGGSATNDGGTGILSALRFVFLDANNKTLKPCGQNLSRIKKIIRPAVLPAAGFQLACDVRNPLCGPSGAALTYAPQKGASPQQAILLDQELRSFAHFIKKDTGKDIAEIPGTGAAGGIAAGLIPYLDTLIVEGTELIIDASGIKNGLDDVDLVITGEGKLDRQSLMGKTICAVIALAKEKRIPVIAICGKLELPETEWKQLGLKYAIEINNQSMSRDESIKNASLLLKNQAAAMVPYLKEL